MGNKLGRRKQVVEERYTRPQGLYVHKDVDHKKLRKLILESKLAPCYPGDDDNTCDHEECPICFLYYPSLNRSRCCIKGICTECFLQMKNPNSTRPTQCPFCKTSNYAVEYRGVKTREEKGLEQLEEQRVIEAKIRMRQQELQDEEDRMQKRLDSSSSGTIVAPGDIDCDSTTAPSSMSSEENEETTSSQHTARHPPHSGGNRDDEFDIDLEDIMVMEAIWLSIQEHGKRKFAPYSGAASSEQYAIQANCISPVVAPVACSPSSPSGGLACAIAALAERQQTSVESSSLNNTGNFPGFNTLPGCSAYYKRLDRDGGDYPPIQCSSNISPDCRMVVARDDGKWGGSDAAEAGTSHASSETAEDAVLPPPPPLPLPLPLPPGDENHEMVEGFQNPVGPIVPESFEEQMMLAMAVSLAEVRTMTTAPSRTWQ